MRYLFQRVLRTSRRPILYYSTMADPTKLVYQQDMEKLLHKAKILSVVPVSALAEPDQALVKDTSGVEHAIITDSTIFHVQGGGQPSDIGIMSASDDAKTDSSSTTFEVKSVRQPAQGGQILHFGRFAPVNRDDDDGGAAATLPGAGDELQQHVDAEKRNLHSRLHTGGHVMSLAIHALCREGAIPKVTELKASHYPDSAAVTFHGSLEAKHKDIIQAKTDEFVRLARPIKIHWWPMEELMEKCYGTGDGFALPEGETLGRVVEMEGLGCYPCGGTHVQDCGQVGKIEVKKISRSKGTTKVSYRVA